MQSGTRHELSVRADGASPEALYALDNLIELAGYAWRHAEAAEEADIGYGEPARVVIPRCAPLDWNDPRPRAVPIDGLKAIRHRLDDGGGAGRESATFAFDLAYATYACLLGVWEAADPSDEAGCPVAAEGWLVKNGLVREPLVHRYAQALADALASAGLPRAAAKSGRASIVVTHDIDINFRHHFRLQESVELARRAVAGKDFWSALRRTGGLARRLASTHSRDSVDQFDAWRDLLLPYGVRPCHFVASYGLFDRKTHKNDVPYDVRDPRVRSDLRRISRDGADIGIHFSLIARNSPEQVSHEVERLTEVVGRPVTIARHHWWSLGVTPWRTLRAHSSAGIVLDCSFGFNDEAGFRRGIAAPFRPYDPERREVIPIWSLPTQVMDVAVFDGTRAYDEALDTLRSLYEVVSSLDGVLVLDWHGHMVDPNDSSDCWRGLLDFLAWASERGADFKSPLDVALSR